jgi:prephenate dehydratase
MLDNSRKVSEADEAAMKKACDEHREYLSKFAIHAKTALEVMENMLPKDIRVTVIFRRHTGEENPNTASAIMFTNDDPQKLVAILEYLKRGMAMTKEG